MNKHKLTFPLILLLLTTTIQAANHPPDQINVLAQNFIKQNMAVSESHPKYKHLRSIVTSDLRKRWFDVCESVLLESKTTTPSVYPHCPTFQYPRIENKPSPIIYKKIIDAVASIIISKSVDQIIENMQYHWERIRNQPSIPAPTDIPNPQPGPGPGPDGGSPMERPDRSGPRPDPIRVPGPILDYDPDLVDRSWGN